MKKMKTFFVPCSCITILGSLIATGCLKQESTAPTVITTYETCTYSERQTYTISDNPVYEFNDTAASGFSTVTASTCQNLPSGSHSETVTGRISRVADQLYFGFNGGINVAAISTPSTLSIPAMRYCVNGVEIRGQLSSSSISSPSIILSFDWTLIKNQCTFANPASPSSIPNTSYAGNATPAGTPSATPPSASHPYLIHFASQAGDWIGSGQTATYLPLAGSFTASRNPDNGVTIQFNGNDNWWTLDFAAPNDADLTVGTYTDAARYPFQIASQPGLSVSGTGRACNTLSGEFTIVAITYGTGSSITSFAAEFVQHCEAGVPALYGSVHYNWTPPAMP